MVRERWADYNVVATFADMVTAREAITSLERAGVEEHDISLLGRGAREAAAETDTTERDAGMVKDVTKATAVGTAAGGGAGAVAGLVAGALAWGIPGIGPVVGSGIWAATLGGAGVGAAIGGLVGGTSKLGQDETWAQTYQETLNADHVLIGVHSDRQADIDKAIEILRSQSASKVERLDSEGRPVSVSAS